MSDDQPYIDEGRGWDMKYVQHVNKVVADHLFPKRTDNTMFLKLYEEVGEVVRSPGNADEIADVMIMLLDHASRHGINAGEAILEKLQKNLDRTWFVDQTTGVAYHVEVPE